MKWWGQFIGFHAEAIAAGLHGGEHVLGEDVQVP